MVFRLSTCYSAPAMTNATRKALANIRRQLGVSRLDPRRLYSVSDGAYTWIGDRADLSRPDARALRAIDRYATDPSRYPADGVTAEEYTDICGRCPCVSATHGAAGVANWDDLPQSWRDGSALGPCRPL